MFDHPAPQQAPLAPYKAREADMKSVNVRKTDLLAKLKENRAKHKEDYDKAVVGYWIEVENAILNAAHTLKTNKEEFADGLMLHESPPQNHLSAYDKVITMMEMSVDEIIKLDSAEVDQYVLDNWNWKSHFVGSTTKYMSNVK